MMLTRSMLLLQATEVVTTRVVAAAATVVVTMAVAAMVVAAMAVATNVAWCGRAVWRPARVVQQICCCVRLLPCVVEHI